MRKRGWIKETNDPEELERELEAFFDQSLDGQIVFPIATRSGANLHGLNLADKAWCFRARQLARVVQAEKFSQTKMPKAQRDVRRLAAFPKEARKLPLLLSSYGIRFVVVELIPGATMDGAAFWLDGRPVIAVSLRYDRIDSFWFTLMHEWFHIRAEDAYSFDSDLLVSDGGGISVAVANDDSERLANERASDALVPRDELESFARRLAPIFSKERIVQFAHKVKIHPGIIVGQLQHMNAIGYSAHRDFLVKVRESVKVAALTDGFGESINPDVLADGGTQE